MHLVDSNSIKFEKKDEYTTQIKPVTEEEIELYKLLETLN